MTRRGKPDSHQAQIVEELRQVPGMSVHVLSQYPGQLDLLIGFQGRTYWYEIKHYGFSAYDLTDREQEIMRTWSGHCGVATSADEILRRIGAIK